MEKKFLRNMMIKLETNYGRDKFKITPEIFELWLEMFSDCNENRFKQAVDKCIKENEYAPNIAGLMKYYKEIEATQKDLIDLIRSRYTTICSVWGENYDKATFEEIGKYVMRFPEKTRKTEMVELTHRAISFKHDCEVVGRTDVPTIKEYIQGAR